MHPLEVQTEIEMEWIRTCPVPIMLLEYHPELNPLAVCYPRQLLGAGAFACTFAYQMALALSWGYEEIGFWGMDLTQGTARERLLEAANIAWWVGYAKGKGLKVSFPSDSLMCRHPHRYGYDYVNELEFGKEAVKELVFVALAEPWMDKCRQGEITREERDKSLGLLADYFLSHSLSELSEYLTVRPPLSYT
jgi:hypothetical protein